MNNSGNFFADRTYDFDAADINENKVIAALSYLAILFFLPLVVRPQSAFGRFHANQGLILFIFSAVLNIALTFVGGILSIIPLLGPLVAALLSSIGGLITLLLFLFGLINTLQGRARELPFIGVIKIIS